MSVRDPILEMKRRETAKSFYQEAVKEAHEYQYYNSALVDAIGYENIYKEEEEPSKWNIDKPEPYLQHVKSCTKRWPHLKQLADFMQVSTTPLRWKEFTKGGKWEGKDHPNGREKRAERTNVTRLDFPTSGGLPKKSQFRASSTLRAALQEQKNSIAASQGANPAQTTKTDRAFRLFIVEDLSRDVIELLGNHYDIEPTFFRDHIFDYAWYNVRDRWFDPPRLQVAARQQRWVQIRFATSRYFENQADFVEGRKKFDEFNVYRRLEDDQNNSTKWDAENSIVGVARNRATFWLDQSNKDEGPVAIILVDPTVSIGYELWKGYRNWEQTPSMRETTVPHQEGPPGLSFYQDLIYWLETPGAFKPSLCLTSQAGTPLADMHQPIQALLYMIASQWLMIGQYLNTRLAQVEWETAFPEHFLMPTDKIDVSLRKLHIWRRLLPTYIGMITDTLEEVFSVQCATTSNDPAQSLSPSVTPHTTTTFCQRQPPPGGVPSSQPSQPNQPKGQHHHHHTPIRALQADFLSIHTQMTSHQNRIDRLTTFVTSMISINDSHRGLDESRNVFWLTGLATCFIPLSLLASVFSMTTDLQGIRDTAKTYAWIGVVLVTCTLVGAWLLTSKHAREIWMGPARKWEKWWREEKKKRMGLGIRKGKSS